MAQTSTPGNDVLETLFYKQVRKCQNFKATLDLYEYEATHKGGPKSYQDLYQRVRTHLAEKHKRSIERQMQAKPVENNFAHTAARGKRRRARKGRNKGDRGEGSDQPPSYTPPRTREESRGKSPSGENMRPMCNSYLLGKCMKGETCREWHIPMCRFHARGSCGADQNCIFLHDPPPKNPGGNTTAATEADLSPLNQEGSPKA